MPCSVTITVRSSSPNNDKAVSCFVTIHCSPEMFYSFRRVSQFLDMWEWKPVCLGTFLSHMVNWNPVVTGRCRCSWNKGTSISSFTEVSETSELPEYSHGVSIIASVCKVISTLFWKVSKGYSAALSAVPVPWNLCTGTLDSWGPGDNTWGGSGSRVSQAGLRLSKLNSF